MSSAQPAVVRRWSLEPACNVLGTPSGTKSVTSSPSLSSSLSSALSRASTGSGNEEGRPGVQHRPEHKRVLLCGTGDVTSLLRTAACAPADTELEFVLAEQEAGSLARAMLLLDTLFPDLGDKEADQSLDARVTMFLELHSNMLIQSRTLAKMQKQARRLSDALSGDKVSEKLPLAMTTQHLRFKDIDAIDDNLRLYRAADHADLAKKQWDARLRRQYRDRYDVRANLADWDLHMALHDTIPWLHEAQYMHWRETGVAWELRDCKYTAANPSFFSIDNTHRVPLLLGDVRTSPLISVAGFIENAEENAHLLKQGTEGYVHDSYTHAVHNVSTWCRQIEQRTAGMSIVLTKAEPKALATTWAGKFDAIYLANTLVARCQSDLPSLASPDGCRVVLESLQYVLDLNKQQRGSVNDRIGKLGASLGWRGGHSSKTMQHLFIQRSATI